MTAYVSRKKSLTRARRWAWMAILCAGFFVLSVSLPSFAFADNGPEAKESSAADPYEETTIAALLGADESLDGSKVRIEGEAIGDILNATSDERMCWVTLKPLGALTNETIAVWMTQEDAAKITYLGKYNVRGTVLRVEGVFSLICPAHEGQTDVHAQHVTVIQEGEIYREPFDIVSFAPGFIAVAVGLLLMIVYYFVRRRQR